MELYGYEKFFDKVLCVDKLERLFAWQTRTLHIQPKVNHVKNS